MFHYGVAVNLAKPLKAKRIVNGQLEVSLQGLDHKILNARLVKPGLIPLKFTPSQLNPHKILPPMSKSFIYLFPRKK